MGILTRQSDGSWVDGKAQEVADLLKNGKPTIGWRGYPNLELRQGVLKLPNGMIGRRWEVWTYTPDGSEEMVAHWKLHELDQILLDMVQMDPHTPGRISTLDKIDQANEAKEKEVMSQFRDALGELQDHALRLDHDRNEGLSTFRGFPGAENLKANSESE